MRLNFPRIKNNHSFSRKVSVFVQVSFIFTDVYNLCILVLKNNILKFSEIFFVYNDINNLSKLIHISWYYTLRKWRSYTCHTTVYLAWRVQISVSFVRRWWIVIERYEDFPLNKEKNKILTKMDVTLRIRIKMYEQISQVYTEQTLARVPRISKNDVE